MPVTVIVLVEDIQPKWEPDYGVRMKLTSYVAVASPFEAHQRAGYVLILKSEYTRGQRPKEQQLLPLSAASVHQRVKDRHIEDLFNSPSPTEMTD
jgi:hypothetical protein